MSLRAKRSNLLVRGIAGGTGILPVMLGRLASRPYNRADVPPAIQEFLVESAGTCHPGLDPGSSSLPCTREKSGFLLSQE